MKPGLSLRSVSAIAALLASLSIAAVHAIAAGKALDTQTSREGAVTVKVTPLELSVQTPVWHFEVVFDTHVADLNHDVLAIATLSGGGKEYRAVRWDGDKPGGHHRKGVLQFDAIRPAPESVTLVVRNVAGTPERRFSWRLAAP